MTTRLQIEQMELIEGGNTPCRDATIRLFISGIGAAAAVALLSNPITVAAGAATVATVAGYVYSAYEVVRDCGGDSEE